MTMYPLASAPYSDPVLPASAANASAANSAPTKAASSSASPSDASGPALWSHGSFSFKDLLDIVNPLQHIPVVGSIYRYLTGDEPSGGARIVGDSIYGGPIGFGVSVVSTAFLTDSKGEDVGEQLLANVFGPRNDSPTVGTPVVASATPASATPATATPATAAARTAATVAAPAPVASAPQAAAAPAAPRPVAMNNLFRSPPATAPASPEQSFLAQTAQFQHEISTGRGANGAVINNRPVPLELSSNLLPSVPAGAHILMPPSSAAPAGNPMPAPASSSQAVPAASPPPVANPAANPPNPIAQKMLDALDKYEQLKKQEQQQDSTQPAAPPKVDLSL
jgi:hypothetical protein